MPKLSRLLAAALLLLSGLAAQAQPLRCDLNGESVNPANGNTTAGKTGLMRCRTEDGALQREEELKNGRFMGRRVFYSREGRKEHYVNEKGNLDGLAREFYRSGKLKEESLYSNGERSGLGKRFYENGQLELLSFAIIRTGGNSERGANLEYNEEGKLTALQCGARSLLPEDRAPCGFAGAPGKVEFYSRSRSSSGRLVKRASYREGVLVESTDLNDAGQPQRSYSLKDGIETTREYFPDGKPRRERALTRDGNNRGRDGAEREWASNGQMVLEKRYADGAESAATEWFMNGNLKQKRASEGAGRDALVRSERYYDTGKLAERSTTRGGRPVGKRESFDEAGTLREEAMYDERGTLKNKRSFDEHGKLSADEEYFEDGSRKLKPL
ncbi:MAG: hypothetical protein JWN73_4236 [Betaproteobacteria bacterium]|nr:hypothetical protein [Betaproteobacteria bacterium]